MSDAGRHGGGWDDSRYRGSLVSSDAMFVCQDGPFIDFTSIVENGVTYYYYGQLGDGMWVRLQCSPVEMGLVAEHV